MAPKKNDILTNSVTHVYALKCYPCPCPVPPVNWELPSFRPAGCRTTQASGLCHPPSQTKFRKRVPARLRCATARQVRLWFTTSLTPTGMPGYFSLLLREPGQLHAGFSQVQPRDFLVHAGMSGGVNAPGARRSGRC